MKKKTTEQYNLELKNKGLNISCVEYRGALISIDHICINNHVWHTSPSRVLVSKDCPQCLGNQTSKKWSVKEEQFLKENYYIKGTEFCSKELKRSIHSIRLKASRMTIEGQNHRLKSHEQYEKDLMEIEADCYPLERYINAYTAINHSCIEGHVWKGLPTDIFNKGSGCPVCAKSGFNPGKPAILYYIKIKDEYNNIYYKIGVTNRTIKSRFSREDKSKIITVLLEKSYKIGKDAYDIEQNILKEFEDKKAETCILASGNSELFSEDVLNLDHT